MRKPRHLEHGATYHVTARTNRQEFIFAAEVVKKLFFFLLKRAKKKYKFKLKHYAIMSNHIHLLIEPRHKDDLPKIMQWLLGCFASRFNRLFGLKGHVWWDRYRSNIVKGPRKLQDTFRYISENPVKAGLADTADAYGYSGIYMIKRKLFYLIEPPDQLHDVYLKSLGLMLFGSS